MVSSGLPLSFGHAVVPAVVAAAPGYRERDAASRGAALPCGGNDACRQRSDNAPERRSCSTALLPYTHSIWLLVLSRRRTCLPGRE